MPAVRPHAREDVGVRLARARVRVRVRVRVSIPSAKVSKKIASKGGEVGSHMGGRSCCHVPASTATPGRSGQLSVRMRARTSGCAWLVLGLG